VRREAGSDGRTVKRAPYVAGIEERARGCEKQPGSGGRPSGEGVAVDGEEVTAQRLDELLGEIDVPAVSTLRRVDVVAVVGEGALYAERVTAEVEVVTAQGESLAEPKARAGEQEAERGSGGPGPRSWRGSAAIAPGSSL